TALREATAPKKVGARVPSASGKPSFQRSNSALRAGVRAGDHGNRLGRGGDALHVRDETTEKNAINQLELLAARELPGVGREVAAGHDHRTARALITQHSPKRAQRHDADTSRLPVLRLNDSTSRGTIEN